MCTQTSFSKLVFSKGQKDELRQFSATPHERMSSLWRV